ncbi:MAG TPA: CPBP family intramembrane glutamic endopeptidase [Pseudonocardiaceae bacterium]
MTVPVVGPPTRTSRDRRARLLAEFLLVFFGVVGVYQLAGSPGNPIPPLLLFALGSVWYLRRQPDFDRRAFGRLGGLRGQLPAMLGLWVLAVVVAVVALAVISPDRLFQLPRERPLVWAMVTVFYPLFSVYPQELVFRGFLFHRYAPVFGTGTGIRLASAAAFGFVHIIYGNLLAVVLSTVGGWLFATRYQRSRSLLVASLEHALYGLLVFTVGLGEFFYHGAVGR